MRGVEYCQNCGKKSSVFKMFALPGVCMECHTLPSIGHHYNTITGARLDAKPKEQEQLFEEHRAFMMQHAKADMFSYDTDGTLTQVIYLSPLEKAKLAEQGYPLPWRHNEQASS